jgi:hypothetical protein
MQMTTLVFVLCVRWKACSERRLDGFSYLITCVFSSNLVLHQVTSYQITKKVYTLFQEVFIDFKTEEISSDWNCFVIWIDFWPFNEVV